MKDYYLFLDESGHHGLKKVNQQYPIFLLCGCVFEKKYYKNQAKEKVNNLKIEFFNTKDVILHSRDIRKWQKDFKVLGDPKLRSKFYQKLDELITDLKFIIIASAILKDELIKQYGPKSNNPYDLSLNFILERTVFLTDNLNCFG